MMFCTYHNLFGIYTCEFTGQNIYALSNDVYGEHIEGLGDNNVEMVMFNDCKLHEFPRKCAKKFRNLQGISIFNSHLGSLSRNDLFEYRSLRAFYFEENNIDFLSGDLFDECKYAEMISFRGNPLTTIEPNILDRIEFLGYIDLNGLNIKYGCASAAPGRLDLTEIKKKIKEQFMENHMNKDNFWFKMHTLIDENQKLKAENDELKSIKTFVQSDKSIKDFYINIGNRQFQVHKLFLAAQSPTIAEILRNNPKATDLNLVDISVNIFEDILKVLYTDELPIEADFMQLFAAAGRLKIKKLMDYAAGKILEQLNAENALELLNLGNKFGHEELKNKSFEEIKRKYPKIEFKDEMSEDGEKVKKMIEIMKKQEKAIKRQEDILKKLEEEMKSLMN